MITLPIPEAFRDVRVKLCGMTFTVVSTTDMVAWHDFRRSAVIRRHQLRRAFSSLVSDLLEEVLIDGDDVIGALNLDAHAVLDHQGSEAFSVDQNDPGG